MDYLIILLFDLSLSSSSLLGFSLEFWNHLQTEILKVFFHVLEPPTDRNIEGFFHVLEPPTDRNIKGFFHVLEPPTDRNIKGFFHVLEPPKQIDLKGLLSMF